jgi:hypothetical protein
MDDVPAVLGVLTGLATVVLSLGIGFWWIYWSYRKKGLQYQERHLMIERGLTPPLDLPTEKRMSTPEDALRRGTVMLFLGVGLGVAYIVLANSGGDGPPPWLAGSAAGIVGLLGLGYLTYYFIARRNAVEAREKSGMPM